MKKIIKWLLITGGILFVLVIASLIIIPMFLDVQKFKPQIEKKVEEATGRPFSIGGELKLSLFPWVGLEFSDLQLGNPPAFKEKDFISIKSFEVKVRLIPLLSKEIQVKRFVADEPRMFLIKSRSGKANWEGIGKPKVNEPAKIPEGEKKQEGETGKGLKIESIAVNEFTITKAYVLFVDQSKEQRHEISDLNLSLKDVSFERPLKIDFSSRVNGKPLSVRGIVGPLGKEPGQGTIQLDLAVKALEELEVFLKGSISNPAANLSFNLDVRTPQFSPRRIISALGKKFPVVTADPEVLKRIALKAGLSGTKSSISISDGILELDDSEAKFTLKASEFSKPRVDFDLNMNQIDLDRYLPPHEPRKEQKKEEGQTSRDKTSKPDYSPLRKMVLDGDVRIAELRAKGAKLRDIHLKVKGKDGIFKLDPMIMQLYEGNMKAEGDLDVRQDTPKTSITLHSEGIQIGPLVKDVLNKDIIEGTFKSNINLNMAGDNADAIKRTLTGQGDINFNDGAILGIDLNGMVRNIKSAFGAAEGGNERPKTDFTELKSVFTITNGLLETKDTRLVSPVLRVLAKGTADLVRDNLDFRVEPKVVGSLKGQGDTESRKGIVVPLKVTGSLSSPEFFPDLEGTLKKGIEETISDPKKLEKLLDSDSGKKDRKEVLEEVGKGLLKSFTD